MTVARDRPAPPARPPWHPLPLTELVTLLAVGCAVGAVLTFGGPRCFWFGGASLALGLLASVEIAAREHFSGRAPQSVTLGGVAGCAAGIGAFLAGGSAAAIVCAGLAVFAVAAAALRRQFRRRARRAAGS
jgi:hypothetical protein